MTRNVAALAVFTLVTGCQGSAAKAPVNDTFTQVSISGTRSISATSKIAALVYGKTSSAVKVAADTYGWFQFSGNVGDDVSVWVRSQNGDAVAFLLDANDDVIAKNDDAGYETTDAHVTATLPKDGTYYIAFREYSYSKATFTVALAGSGVFSCGVDSDCTAVPLAGCCDNGYLAAVNTTRVSDYDVLYACTQTSPICSQLRINDTRVAICDFTSSKCEMIQPGDIVCGGNTTQMHGCPSGWNCKAQLSPNLTGVCVQAE